MFFMESRNVFQFGNPILPRTSSSRPNDCIIMKVSTQMSENNSEFEFEFCQLSQSLLVAICYRKSYVGMQEPIVDWSGLFSSNDWLYCFRDNELNNLNRIKAVATGAVPLALA